MDNRFDELAKALAGGLSRREALRRIAGGFAGALVASLGLGKSAEGAPALNSRCEKFCRNTCGVSPGGGNAFGKCVSSCEACVNNTGILPCACPPPGSKAVVCCTCQAFDCAGSNSFGCNGNPECRCTPTVDGSLACTGKGVCADCQSNADCVAASQGRLTVCAPVFNCCGQGPATACFAPCQSGGGQVALSAGAKRFVA